MNGLLQSRVYGGGHKRQAVIRRGGQYNHAPIHQLGHYNGAVKKLGHSQGVSVGKAMGGIEIYPKY